MPVQRTSEPHRIRHQHSAFCEHYPPLKVRWWSHAPHMQMLGALVAGGRSAEETEALDYCFRRVFYDGARDPIHGVPCICLREVAPSVGEARGSLGGDGVSGLLSVLLDLEHAADGLPIRWRATRRILLAQSRPMSYRKRFGAYAQGCPVQDDDRLDDPCGADEDRRVRHGACYQEAFVRMAVALGYQAVCRWPRRPLQVAPLVRDVGTGRGQKPLSALRPAA